MVSRRGSDANEVRIDPWTQSESTLSSPDSPPRRPLLPSIPALPPCSEAIAGLRRKHKTHKGRLTQSAGLVQPKGAVEGSCLTFAATFIVRIGEFESPLVFSPLKDITAYELATLFQFIASSPLSVGQQGRLLSLPKEMLRHISTSGCRLSEAQILPLRKQNRSSLLSRIVGLFSFRSRQSVRQ